MIIPSNKQFYTADAHRQIRECRPVNVIYQGFYQAFGKVQITTETVENPLRFPGHKTAGARFESGRITA
ncbi:hypothetical protein [Ostreibacterium oceani]|uniref:Uncharacterized protein n=1 Tax=Ostreibacterium oceani TaxID=2654998 RepID=A0A6N7F160_9GAMM|nr:hypothetical protein [Ostreibacterium oceani]MPV86528.1 hypothetical protein [Ostreibacterium oceani]